MFLAKQWIKYLTMNIFSKYNEYVKYTIFSKYKEYINIFLKYNVINILWIYLTILNNELNI